MFLLEQFSVIYKWSRRVVDLFFFFFRGSLLEAL